MASPAIVQVIEAVVARVEAIVPSIDPEVLFRRSSEAAPATTRARRWFDLDFTGQPADLSAAGQGTQTVGQADVLGSFELHVGYPVARQMRALETKIAADSELIRRALSRSANWDKTPVRALRSFRSTVDRTQSVPTETEPGVIYLDVAVTLLYRETE